MRSRFLSSVACALALSQVHASPVNVQDVHYPSCRQRTELDSGWKFKRYEVNPDNLIYDHRPDLENLTDVAVLKPWILPSGNDFIRDPSERYERPKGNPGNNVSFVQDDFDDATWDTVNVPHDWAIEGPFYTGPDEVVPVGGGMGRLPVFGVGWYRRKLEISEHDRSRRVFLEVDGAMSYAMVWLNGELVGGWPYPYNSFWLDLTPHLRYGQENQLAIRLDNPVESARWYPGGGLYRSVWLTKVDQTHIGQWGAQITPRVVDQEAAVVDLDLTLDSISSDSAHVTACTHIYEFDAMSGGLGDLVAKSPSQSVAIAPNEKTKMKQSVHVQNPKLWGPPPTQTPHLYVGVTSLFNSEGALIDSVNSRFGIRSLEFTGNDGLRVNGERIQIQGVNDHHDLGAIGAAFNVRAAERKLEILREMGTNAIRTSHNPPAVELLDLADQMGFLVQDEVFDCWKRNKTENDFHLIFEDWHEQDLRSMIRRDGNHPSIVMWSFGNEVVEQSYSDELREIATELHEIVNEEDTSRPSTSSMNVAQPDNEGAPFLEILDVLSLNYQGEGIRNSANYNVTEGTSTPPAYPLFHEAQPDKLIITTESASALSTRHTFFFPVVDDGGAPVNETSGGNEALGEVSAYGLYSANFGSSPDKAFASEDRNPYVGGEFVWTGFDYIGEPTPYYDSRSSYSGIIDLAGFKKDRFFLYQARWRPDLPMAHIIPHWNWPDRVGKVTPVHVYTSGDEAELFLNGRSMGRQALGQYEYRIRWDEVKYEPGELHVVSYKGGKQWATATVKTTGPPASLKMTADRAAISSDGKDLVYVSVDVLDADGLLVPTANSEIEFSASDSGEIVATDNGYPADLVPFPSTTRKAFSGKALAIVKAAGGCEPIRITASSGELGTASVEVQST